MGLNVLFYVEETPEQTCQQTCEEDDPRNIDAYENSPWYSNTTSCVETCEDEAVETNHALYASLISAGIAIPVMGLLNFGFGWLRRPLNADMLNKAGSTLENIEEKEKADFDRLKQSERLKVGKTRTLRCHGGDNNDDARRHPCARLLMLCCGWIIEWPLDCIHCIKVQCHYIREATCPRRSIAPISMVVQSTKTHGPRERAQVGKRRANVADQMHIHSGAAGTLFARYDRVRRTYSNVS